MAQAQEQDALNVYINAFGNDANPQRIDQNRSDLTLCAGPVNEYVDLCHSCVVELVVMKLRSFFLEFSQSVGRHGGKQIAYYHRFILIFEQIIVCGAEEAGWSPSPRQPSSAPELLRLRPPVSTLRPLKLLPPPLLPPVSPHQPPPPLLLLPVSPHRRLTMNQLTIPWSAMSHLFLMTMNQRPLALVSR